MGRWSSSIKFAGYFLLIVLPYATLAVIGLALGYHPFGDWLREALGNGRFPLGVVGVVGPYCVGALKELIADFGPGRNRGFAEDMLAAVDGAGHLPAVPPG